MNTNIKTALLGLLAAATAAIKTIIKELSVGTPAATTTPPQPQPQPETPPQPQPQPETPKKAEKKKEKPAELEKPAEPEKETDEQRYERNKALTDSLVKENRIPEIKAVLNRLGFKTVREVTADKQADFERDIEALKI